MFVVDKGLNEKFHKEFKWKWPGAKMVDVYLLTKRLRREKYSAMLLFIDELEDGGDEEGDSLINRVTITRQLSLEDIDNIQKAISEEYGQGYVSDIPTTKNLVIEQEAQSYIR